MRSGVVNYRNLSLSVPVKYRYKVTENLPIFFLIGFNPYFNITSASKWQFDEFEYNIVSNKNISEIKDQQEDLKQSFFSRDLILLGCRYKRNKFMFDMYFSGGSTIFENDFILSMDKLSIVLNGYYRLN